MSPSDLLGRLAAPFRAWEAWLFAPADARIYALVRIGYAITCAAVVLDLWPNREAFFTTGGMIAVVPDWHPLVLLRHVQTRESISIVMVCVLIACVSLAAGLLTRAMTFVLWSWTVSYSLIMVPADSGYDGVLRVVGLVLLVSPAARAFALDGRLLGQTRALVPSYGLRLLQFQFCVLYFATVWIKAPEPAWRNGQLMSYFMMSAYSRFPSPAWASLGRTSTLMSWGTLAIEGLLPVLVWSTHFRRSALFCGVCLHLGIALGSTIGLFTLAMCPLYAVFLQPADLTAVSSLVRRCTRSARAARTVSSSAETTTDD